MSRAADGGLTPEQVQAFQRDGYLLLEGYFPEAEMAQLLRVARADRELAAIAADRRDSEGRRRPTGAVRRGDCRRRIRLRCAKATGVWEAA